MNKFDNTDSVLDKITNSYASLSKSGRKVASYIIDNFSAAALLSSSELARATGVSDTTIIRFAKALGYSGFIEFKRSIRADLNTNFSPANLNFSPYDYLKNMEPVSGNQLMANYMKSILNDVTTFLQNLDYGSLDSIASLVLRAQTVYVVGIGSDSIVARFLAINFRKIGLHVTLIQDEDCVTFDRLLHLCEKDLIIMSSYPRLLNAEKILAQEAKYRNVPFITITASNASAMLLDGDINIAVNENKNNYFNSYVLPMIFCNLLLLRIQEKDPVWIEEHIKDYVEKVSIAGWI